MEIHKAKLSDITRLNEISIASKMHWGYPQEWLQKWKEDLTIKPENLHTWHIYKAVLKDQIIGFCVIIEHGEYYEIEHQWIDPPFIGKGLGKQLLNETIKIVISQGSEIIVVADPHAEGFYQRMGFETFGRLESFPKGRFLPKMRKVMKSSIL